MVSILKNKIPDEWKKINLGTSCVFERGIEPGSEAYNSEGVGERFLRVADITESRNNLIYVDVVTTKKLQKSDIALTLDGTVGAVKTGLEGVYSTGIRKVSFKDEEHSNHLLFYILQSYHIQKTIDLYASGSTIKHASSSIPHLVTVIPKSYDEQEKITEVLATIDDVIGKTNTVIKKYKSIKTGMMQNLFHYGIDKNGNIRAEKTHKFKNSPLGRIPAEWNVLELGKVALVQRGKFQHRPRNDPRFYGGNIPFVQTGDVANCNMNLKTYSQTLNERGLRVSRLFPEKTIVMTIAANIGDVAIADFDMAFPDSLVGINVLEMMDNNYLYFYLTTRKTHLNEMATESARKNINLEFLNPYPIIVPPKCEQEKIARALIAIEENIEIEEVIRKKLLSIKVGLMEDLLCGKVRVNSLVGK